MYQSNAILPAEAYYSHEWFDKEQEKLFGNTWQFAGLIEDLKEVGDYLTIKCGHHNIFVILNENKELKAFHNICKHRGTKLLNGKGQITKNITCPYHNWSYNIKGQLLNIPNKSSEFPNVALDTICLPKASVDIWKGMIWVHPEQQAKPLYKWLEGCDDLTGPHQPSRLIEYPETYYEKEVQANWKIIAENFMDVYHLNQLHAHTLNMYDHVQAKYHFHKEHFIFWEPLSKKYEQHIQKLIPYKRIQEMTDEYLGAFAPWLFPNLGLAESEASWSTFHLIPLAPDKTKIVSRTKMEEMTYMEYIKQQNISITHWKKIMKNNKVKHSDNEDHALNSGDFIEEDIYVCEQLQKSVKSPHFGQHLALNKESSIKYFQENIKQWVTE